MRVLIIADDLTGALDTAAPFSSVGLKTIVAPFRTDLPAAISAKPDVLAVSSGSRDLPLPEALKAVGALMDDLLGVDAEIVFKKIDSRLQGHPAAEAAAVARRFGRSTLWIAPAIPELGRIVCGGCVSGHAIKTPIDVRSAFAGTGLLLEIEDASTMGDMVEIARILLSGGGHRLVVAASGLARALSVHLADGDRQRPSSPLPGPALLAISSRDPVTATQIERLREAASGLYSIRVVDGRWREMSKPAAAIDVLVTTVDGGEARCAAEAGKDFADGTSKLVREGFTGTLITSGGNTTADILEAIGVGPLLLQGEWQPGFAISTPLAAQFSFTLISKSGSFGDPDCLASLHNTIGSGPFP